MDPADIRQRLAAAAPALWRQLSDLAAGWTAPVVRRLDRGRDLPAYPKSFNDPVWGTIELFPWEIVLLDSPLLQRLRGVRQLGMAHLVYPAASHDRLEHSRGVVEASERVLRALERSARQRRQFGERDEQIPDPSPLDQCSVRLAGLLHDVGHGPFSHALEPLVRERDPEGFRRAEEVLLEAFAGVARPSTGEVVAVLLVLSEPMRRVLEHPRLGATDRPAELAPAVAARLLGARCCLDAGYLAGVISGPLDADKFDYMARDSYHAGQPTALDLNRLIATLEVVTVTPENAPTPELRQRALAAPRRRLYEAGISLAGLGAYEQMIVARVNLYDRLYYHHKVRAAEAMVPALFRVAEAERGEPFTVADLFCDCSDDTLIEVVSGRLIDPCRRPGGPRARALGQALRERRIYHRAYAFARRFLADSGESEPERSARWEALLAAVNSRTGAAEVERAIFEAAERIRAALPELCPAEEELRPERVLIDVAFNKVVARGGEVLTRTETGSLATPNLFFDPEKWASAYEQQKQVGYVFAPREFVPLVALAARLVFRERFGVAMTTEADRAAKTADRLTAEMVERAAALFGGDGEWPPPQEAIQSG